MPEAIVLAAADLALDAGVIGEAGVAFVEGTTFGIGNAALIGGAVLGAAAIGLQFALSRPQAPKPEDGTQPIRAALQPRQRGYWTNRLSGAVMLATTGGAAPTTAVMAAAFHQGPIDSVIGFYFDDDAVSMFTDISHGGASSVNGPGGRYASTSFSVNLGHPGQVADPNLTGAPTGGLWTSAFVGTGVAYWGMQCTAPADPTQFAKLYPRDLPKPSVVAKCSPIWDPRDGAQDANTPSTWVAKANPVLQLLDYLRAVDGGLGLDLAEFCPPARLTQWIAEATLCEFVYGDGSRRYQSAGWYTYDTKPEDIINKILATCDGWLAPAGDGTLALTVGVYREPTLPPITEAMVLDMQVALGAPDEQLVNQLDCSWTNPSEDYATDQSVPIADGTSIALIGEIKRQPLDLSWVQWLPQVVRLGERGLRRVNPARTGTLVGRDICSRYAGERWIKLQFPFPGLEDCVVEVQDFKYDVLAGRVTIKFMTVDSAIIAGI